MSISKVNKYDSVYNSLKNLITEGEFAPGEKLVEMQLSEKLDASRTPIRDALRRLERENLVTMHPSQGATVSKIDNRTIINLYECRAALEGLAVKQACDYLDETDLQYLQETLFLSEKYYSEGNMEKTVEKNTLFHNKLIESSNNGPLQQMMENIQTQIIRYRTLTSSLGFRKEFLEEHNSIFEALQNKHGEIAQTLMIDHIHADLESIIKKVENNKEKLNETT